MMLKVYRRAGLAARCGLFMALGVVGTAPARAVVLLDLFRGTVGVPQSITPNFNNEPARPWAPSDRYGPVLRLISFGATDSNIAAAVVGTSLPTSWPSFEVRSGADVVCEIPNLPGTTNACLNSIQGVLAYAALLVPSAGTYTITGSLGCNDGASFDNSALNGTDYRHLGYAEHVETMCTADDGITNGTFTTTAPNTLINVRLAWYNWGSNGGVGINWAVPGVPGSVPVPAANLYDPSNPLTYLAASDDDLGSFSGTSGGTSTINVFANDRVNVASPAVASGAGANITSFTTSGAPAGVTLASDGTISIPAGLPGGSYSFTYDICRSTLQPAQCATARVSFRVSGAPAAVPSLGAWCLIGLAALLAGLGGGALGRGRSAA